MHGARKQRADRQKRARDTVMRDVAITAPQDGWRPRHAFEPSSRRGSAPVRVAREAARYRNAEASHEMPAQKARRTASAEERTR